MPYVRSRVAPIVRKRGTDDISVMSPPRPPRILVVDDDASIRRAIVRLITLDFPDAVIGEAADGHTALRMIAAQRWDVVLLDMSMPEMSGLEVLRELRARNELVPVVIVSGLPAAEYEAGAIAAGAFGFIEKVRLPDELRIVISSFVSDRQIGAQP